MLYRTMILITLFQVSTGRSLSSDTYLYANGGNVCAFGSGAFAGATLVLGNAAVLTLMGSAGLTAGACNMYHKAAVAARSVEDADIARLVARGRTAERFGSPSNWLLSSGVLSSLAGFFSMIFCAWLLGYVQAKNRKG